MDTSHWLDNSPFDSTSAAIGAGIIGTSSSSASCITSLSDSAVGSLLTPLSADELLHSLPSTSQVVAGDCARSMHGVASFGAGSSVCDDLDHIMQVIVGN